ncbi:conserved hypothetical protein [Leishmania infantum JPCM5]|uniref:Uncharacterized protein n=2 Tax=Leishmania infantum TaxID=5671 RepID=A4HVL4_LEIIN|nr:conserved hypothetical protein [Leishmania infantum JPCM5]CAM66481.1 conserved hypothetical protein [Leishmania infantum JPCM5]|eukprot:XP_001464105.1 conserved hypothetical protein [Leishmania infantum JPCM5]
MQARPGTRVRIHVNEYELKETQPHPAHKHLSALCAPHSTLVHCATMAQPSGEEAITSKSFSGTAKGATPHETISIAFTHSQYATPCHDHTVPGSTPGHRLRRLGRRHQPADILHNHLNHALVAHSGVVTTAKSGGGYYHHHCSDPWEGTADHPAPPGGNCVLHTKNGGKRHFDEPTGLFSEPVWHPSRRVILPPQVHARPPATQRRGRGVYNTTDGWIHPDAEAAQVRREEEAVRQHSRGGKAQVARPPDHTLEELSMWVRTGKGSGVGAAGPSSEAQEAAPAAVTAAANGRERKRHLLPHHKTNTSMVSAVAPLTGPPPPKVLADYNDSQVLPAIGQGVAMQRCTAAEADALAQRQREKRVQHLLQTMRAAAAESETRAADIQAVRELPSW